MNYLTYSAYVEIAIAAHKGQFRRDGKTPYITHVRRVVESFLLIENGLARKIAWLHDVLEDGRITEQELKDKGISFEVMYSIKLLKHFPEENYVDYIRGICVYAPARLVKIADVLDNLTDDPTPRQVKKYLKALKILIQEHL